MSFSFAKLKSSLSLTNNKQRHSLSLEPEIGFQLTLEPSATSDGNAKSKNSTVPSLNVNLISARHLPSLFGFKSVQGYQIKIKLFPGSKRYDSTIQTNSWPKFDETFKFPLEPNLKPSIKMYSKEKESDNLPEKLCSGRFVVFTVYALLELPAGTFNRFKGTYKSLREKGNSFLNNNKPVDGNNEKSKEPKEKSGKQENVTPSSAQQLTKSESRRNIGSVTCFLDAKIFKLNQISGRYVTDEMWLPVKDITMTPSKASSTNNSAKGQMEIILELCDSLKDEIQNDRNSTSLETEKTFKKQWSLNEMKKKVKTGKSSKNNKELYLKVTTTKMRCSIKVKDEFENSAGQIYVKTSIFEHGILSNSWKCDNFLPSLSTRWDPEISSIVIPIANEESLKNISIKTTVATKTKVGKKIVLGCILIGPETTGTGKDHWNSVVTTRNEAITKWHNFQ